MSIHGTPASAAATWIHGTPAGATTKYATVAELKTYLGIGGGETADDALLDAFLARATKAIDTYTGRRFQAMTATRSYGYDAIRGSLLLLDEDLLTVAKLSNGDTAGTEITSGYYWLWPRNTSPYWGIMLKSAWSAGWRFDTDCSVVVTGSWGYSATAPDDVAQACARWAAYMYKQKDAQVFEVSADPVTGQISVPRGMPVDVKQLLEPYRKMM